MRVKSIERGQLAEVAVYFELPQPLQFPEQDNRLVCLFKQAGVWMKADVICMFGMGSGGRRIVYDMGEMRVWLVEADETVTRTYRVSGHEQRVLPGTGTFWIYSTVRYNSVKDNPGVKLDFMMRFAVGDEGLSIGFHAIPRKGNSYIQSTDTLGRPASPDEIRRSAETARQRGLESVCWALLNSTEFVYVR